jgi:hypothetical protein
MWRTIKKSFRPFSAGLLALAFFLVGFPPQYLVEKISERNIVDSMYWAMKDPNVIDKGISDFFKPKVETANAANFQMQTGYYYGNATDNRAITGLGFAPDLVIIKDHTTNGLSSIWKNNAMDVLGETTAYLAVATANIANDAIQSLDADGFTVGLNADTNTVNIFYSWIAFGGSDCTANGYFCTGSYQGSGVAGKTVNTGFQPDLVTVKRSGASNGAWKSSSMGASVTNYFSASAQYSATPNQLITSLDAGGTFTVGNNAVVNTLNNTYWFFAFKENAGVMDVGSYTGVLAGDNRTIDSTTEAGAVGLDFHPDFVFLKGTTAVAAPYNSNESYGDGSYFFTDSNRVGNYIQKLLPEPNGGFQVGTASNADAIVYHYAAFAGAPVPTGSGTFRMAEGKYTGTGAIQSITTGFRPDLVIIKHRDQATDQHTVFRTSLMQGTAITHYLSAAGTIADAITSLDVNGFTLGLAAPVNTLNDTFHWTAYGNAWKPDTKTGASDFFVGVYPSTNVNPTDIVKLPFQPDLVVVKRAATSYGVFRTSSMTGDVTNPFSAVAALAGGILGMNADGFQLGNNAVSNTTINTLYWYFGFKSGPTMSVGQYTGNGGDNRSIATPFNPDFVWVKKETLGTARGGVMKAKTDTGEETRPIYNTAVITTNVIQNFLATNLGFQIGTGVNVNEAANSPFYDFVTWKIPLTFEQSSYRWFENTDTTDVGAVLADGDTSALLTNTGDAFRLRMTLHVNGDIGGVFDIGEENFKLQFASSTGVCDTGFSGETYVDVTDATEIAFKNNTPNDGTALTNNANDPPVVANPHFSHTIVNQTYEEANNFTSIATTLVGQDVKWDFALFDNGAIGNKTYCFRVVNSDDTPLANYSVIPEITTAIVPTFTQNFFRFYVDNGLLKPTVPWSGLGDNEAITITDEPPAALDEKLRLRMTLLVDDGATKKDLPALYHRFRLQYGKQVTSCSAIPENDWANVGASGSATAWRGYHGGSYPSSGTVLSASNPIPAIDRVFDISDRAGTYEESGGMSALNPYLSYKTDDIEYDWILENHSADPSSDYCFRMSTTTTGVMSTPANYPIVHTSGFRPKTEKWQWFDDAENITPMVSLAGEEITPSDVVFENNIKLRITVKDTADVAGSNIKFKLQFSEYSDFSAGVSDVVSQGSCTANSLWCYAEGGGDDNTAITTRKLSDSNVFGSHNETPGTPSTFAQPASSLAEYEFTIKHAGARVNQTYFFRLFDTVTGMPVPSDTDKSFPSLATEGARISFAVEGILSGVDTGEGVTTNITTTPTSLPFGLLPVDSDVIASQRFTVSTNATEGYQIFVRAMSDFLNESADRIDPITGTNAVPVPWATGCPIIAIGCFGYHAGDHTLSGDNGRFILNDTYAPLSTSSHESIAFSSVPVTDESLNIVYRTKISTTQPNGNYESALYYIVVPVF